LRDSPPLFHGRFISHIYPPPKSDVFDDGSVVHEILSTGKAIEEVVAIIPRDALNADNERKGGAWKDFKVANPNKILRKREECDTLIRMVESVRSHPKARWLLEADGHFEHTIAWQDAETGLMLRARPDKISIFSDEWVLSDIKTTRAEDHREFSSAIANYGYHRQAAWYSDAVAALTGGEPQAFCFITVNKTPAHECHVYELMPSAIQIGREENRQLLIELAYRLKTNDWNARDFGTILEIDLPAWAYKQPIEWRAA
jgi:hypothetical protein